MNSLSAAFACLLALSALPLSAAPTPLSPESVAILYNSDLIDSKELALYYAEQRKVPESNIIGLPLSDLDHLSRADFDTTLRDPLAKEFTEREWWTDQKIRVLLCVRGVPFSIDRTPPKPGEEAKSGAHQAQDEASVDSDLTILSKPELSIKGALRNPYFKSTDSAATADLDGFLLVARIDGPSAATCRRMIDDAIAVEKEGLWGRCYLDFSKKDGAYQAGEDWIEAIGQQNLALGIPTIIDRNKDTYVTNYPMRDATLYYGWYNSHRNGPLLNDEFSFKRGAVAVHLHSFSAAHLRNPETRWAGPLLEKGAAATVGNVFEPFLQLSHHFDILHNRLVSGHSLVEAAYMASPVISWQSVVLGDPLYRPFAQLSNPAPDTKTDQDYRIIRNAWLQWPDDAKTRTTKLRTAAARSNSGTLYEAIGLFHLQEDTVDLASAFFSSARQHFGHSADRLRVDLHAIDLLRQSGRKQEVINNLRKLKPEYAGTPEEKPIIALLNILDPPAPPPATPKTATP